MFTLEADFVGNTQPTIMDVDPDFACSTVDMDIASDVLAGPKIRGLDVWILQIQPEDILNVLQPVSDPVSSKIIYSLFLVF